MCTESPAVADVFRCIASTEKRRRDVGDGTSGARKDGGGCKGSIDKGSPDGPQPPGSPHSRRGQRRHRSADDALRQRYFDILQARDGRLSAKDRIRTLRRMVLAQGLPRDSGTDEQKCVAEQGDAKAREGGNRNAQAESDHAEDRCSLRGLVWKILLGTIHTDAVLYIRLVGRGPSSEDVKIREDTFRTFHGDEEFRRRVHEDKLSRINNAFVRLNSPNEATAASREGSSRDVTGSGDGSSGGDSGGSARHLARGESSAAASVKPNTGRGTSERSSGLARGVRKGIYVQGMMVLCAPLLFVMPEVDAFYCFNSLLNDHMPRYVAANLDGVHAGCALVDRTLNAVDPVLFNYLESKFVMANIYAFPLLMSLHACVPPLEETVKLWDAMFSFGVHLEVLVCVAQDPNPYQHVNYRNLPPLDAELLVAIAFSLIPHLPPGLMEEIAQHPFVDDVKPDDSPAEA